MKIRKIQVCLLVILSVLMILSTVCMAESGITYNLNGNIETLRTDNVSMNYNLNGNLSDVTVNDNGDITKITIYLGGNIEDITTPSGEIEFDLNGDIDTVNGDWKSICADVQKH